MDWTYFLPCLWAFLACAGFSIVFNICNLTGLLLCCAGGALGWLVYLLVALTGASDLIGYFVAGMAIAAYSELMARVRKCPVTGYLLISFFPLVPGAGIYYTMLYTMQGEAALAGQLGVHTLAVAGCLAVGVLVTSSLVRLIYSFRKRKGACP